MKPTIIIIDKPKLCPSCKNPEAKVHFVSHGASHGVECECGFSTRMKRTYAKAVKEWNIVSDAQEWQDKWCESCGGMAVKTGGTDGR
jgi:hypothetical protein